jgi:hypothetical protein
MSNFKESHKLILNANKVCIDVNGVLTFNHLRDNRIIRHSPVSSYELNRAVFNNFADVVAFRLMFMEGLN